MRRNRFETPRVVRYAIAALAGSLLLPACSISYAGQETGYSVQNAQCVEEDELNPGITHRFDGEELSRDLNKSPLFRAATVNISFGYGYGSGGLFRTEEGRLVVRTVGHVLEDATSSAVGGIYFPGYGWWNVAGCSIESVSTDKVGEAQFNGDAVSEIMIPDDISAGLEVKIAQGEIKPLSAFENVDPDYFINSGYQARIADAETGTYIDLTFVDESSISFEGLLELYPSSSTEAKRVVCQGMSGTPLQMGSGSEGLISDEAFGSISHVYQAEYESLEFDARYCSSRVGVIKFTQD